MGMKDGGLNVLAKAGIVVGALALAPGLFVLSHLMDDNEVRAEARAERLAAQDEKNRQLIYDELNRRLGNR